MPAKALNRDLKRLEGRAYHREEWSEEILRRYHAAVSHLKKDDAPRLRLLYEWIFVPPTLWPFHIQDVLADCLHAVETGKPLSSRQHLLIDLLPAPPNETICTAVADHELDVQSGAYENLLKTQAKFSQTELAIRSDSELHRQWARIKATFKAEAWRDHKGVIRRTMGAERNLRPSFSVNPRRPGDLFRAAFDAFCLRWNLYGMQNDQPLLLKLAVNITPFGTMIHIPAYWSFDPKRDIRWEAIARLHRVRVPGRQGAALAEGRAERMKAAGKLRLLDKEALRLGMKGEQKHAFLCAGLGWVSATSPKRLSRLRAEFGSSRLSGSWRKVNPTRLVYILPRSATHLLVPALDNQWGHSVPLIHGWEKPMLRPLKGKHPIMLNAAKVIHPAATDLAQRSEPETPDEGKPSSPVAMLCNLTGGQAFCPGNDTPHLPVLAAFGESAIHVCRSFGPLDLERAASENAGALVRSIRLLDPEDKTDRWDDLTFQFGPRSFLYAGCCRVLVFATTPIEARRRVEWFTEKYNLPVAPSAGSFHLIKVGSNHIGCESVTFSANTVLSDDALNLHYGSGSREWHQDYIEKLRNGTHGLSIFEGTPGTGKTFYLRHLMGALKESHRFYFIPTSRMGVLSQPEFIDFWSGERRNYSDAKFVVILEDSDAALMTRGADNRDQVSAILNLSDGMLADFLRLQIICTINCTTADIDPALLRPGRLICHRVFGRLDYLEAFRLAESLGRELPVVRDYSLAEVFSGNKSEGIDRPRIGFAA